MKVAVLERDSVTADDIDFSVLESVAKIDYFSVNDRQTLEMIFRDYDGIVINKTQIDSELIGKSGKLRYIGLFATGYNNVDVQSAAEKGITVCNVSGYSTNAVAQHVMMFVLAASGSFRQYCDSVKRGDWKRSRIFSYYPYPISELCGKTIGIIGYGSIGKRVAVLAEAFGMNVLVSTRSDSGKYINSAREEVFSQSDFVSLHCPLSESTGNLVNEQTLSLMKKSAFLINTSRGGVVDEAALYRALSEKRIAGAFLDTISAEPMKEDFPLCELDNCIITPHVAWAAKETRQRLVNLVAENIRNFQSGSPTNKVN